MSAENKKRKSEFLFGKRNYRLMFIGIALSVFILLFPQHIARDLTELDHGLLSLVMLAMCGCFVHGIGFTPYNMVAKVMFSPLLCWPIAGLAVWMWVL